MTLFNTRDQFNQITQLFSKTFDMTLNKVRHKIALSEGFKSQHALISKLPDTLIQSQPVSSIKSLNLDAMSEGFLCEEIEFEIFRPSSELVDNTDICLTVIAPRAVKFIFEGHVFTTSPWLSKPLSCAELIEKEFDLLNNTEGKGLAFSFDSKYSDSINLAVLQNIVNPTHCITNESFLADHMDVTISLLNNGSYEQYATICKNERVVTELSTLGQLPALGFSYHLNLLLLTPPENFNDDNEQHFEEINPIANYLMFECNYRRYYSEDDMITAFKKLPPPPSPYLKLKTGEELSQFEPRQCMASTYDNDVITVNYLLDYYFCVLDSDDELNPLLTVSNSVKSKIFNGDEALTQTEFMFMKHVSFLVNTLHHLILTGNGNIFSFSHLLELMGNLEYLELDFQQIDDVMLKIPTDKDHNHYLLDIGVAGNTWLNMPSAAWIVIHQITGLLQQTTNAKRKDDINFSLKQLNLLFNFFNERILSHKIEICSDTFTGTLSPLTKAATIRELLVITISLVNDEKSK
ncbi:MAG: hypothetical protein HAW67_06125 [Endozoicomonadaceae bacterium]|nr:hypothetical protein [Endozoicomonadaceae bacterium]